MAREAPATLGWKSGRILFGYHAKKRPEANILHVFWGDLPSVV